MLVDDNHTDVLGYFTFTGRTLNLNKYLDIFKKIFGTRREALVLELARLGVDANHERKGICKYLVNCALEYAIATPTGGIGLLVIANHADKVPFYQKLGFGLLPGEELMLFLTISVIRERADM